MKALFALLVLVPFTAAQADYIPGRVRPSAVGTLVADHGDGIYKGIEEAQITQFQTDGKGITRYDLTINGRTETYEVVEVSRQRCGDQHVARAVDESNGRGEIRLSNFLSNLCDARDNEPEWKVEVSRQGTGEISKLELVGTPEYFMLSQGR